MFQNTHMGGMPSDKRSLLSKLRWVHHAAAGVDANS